MPINLYPMTNPVETLASAIGALLQQQNVIPAARVQYGSGRAAQISQWGLPDAPTIVVGLMSDMMVVRAKGGNTAPGPGMGVEVLGIPPGASVPEPMIVAARALWTVSPQAEIVIYGRAPEDGTEPTEPRSNDSASAYELSAFQILCRVLAALHEILKTGVQIISCAFADPPDREWQYGSVIRMVAAIDVAVPDWALWQITADEAKGTMYQTKDLAQQGTEGGGWKAPPDE